MKREHIVVFILGLFLLAYVLDSSVDPLPLDLSTPYHYLNPDNISTYPFTFASVFIKALGLFIIPLLFMSFFPGFYMLKGASLLVLSALYQLYALQQVASGAETVPLEWSLALALAGMVLLIPMVIFFILGGLSSAHTKLTGEESDAEFFPEDDDDAEVEEEAESEPEPEPEEAEE